MSLWPVVVFMLLVYQKTNESVKDVRRISSEAKGAAIRANRAMQGSEESHICSSHREDGTLGSMLPPTTMLQ